MAVRRRIVVRGSVQGVGFRAALVRAAVSRGVAGWVRNRGDGTLEAVLEGEPERVEALVRFCREGPRGATVTGVDAVEEAPEGLSSFDIR